MSLNTRVNVLYEAMTKTFHILLLGSFSLLFSFVFAALMSGSITDEIVQLPKIVSVSAASQGLLRCTDGNLVPTQGQCPATDQCPAPQDNTVANCSVGDISNSTVTKSINDNNINNESTTDMKSCSSNRFTLHTAPCGNLSSSEKTGP